MDGMFKRIATLSALTATLMVTAAPIPSTAQDAPITMTTSGPVRGAWDGPVATYRGIPYAAPPVGPLRWTPPQPVRPWTAPLDATASGPACEPFGGPPVEDSGEDCLYLEVTAPATAGRKPVMVWLHGGGNIFGTAAEYDARRLAERGDVVVVTVNYRLGIYGFLSHPDLPDSGSFGLLDQQKALRWVRHNAVFFGGDPSNVTVFGESAGGIDTCALLTSPASHGLFDKAAMQSGSCSTVVPTAVVDGDTITSTDDFWTPVEDLRKLGAEMAGELGCADVDCLRDVEPERLAPYTPRFGIATGTRTLPVQPDEALTSGRFHRVPVLSGSNRDESRLTAMFVEYLTGPITQERHDALLDRTFGPDADAVRSHYPVAEYDNDPTLAFAAIETDRVFVCPQLATDRQLAHHTPTYGYEFADRTAPTYTPFLTDLPPGAAHASELAYLFGLRFGGPWGPGMQPVELDTAQRELGDKMIDYWTQFAHTGHPDTPGAWPSFDAGNPYVQSLATGPDGIGQVDAAAEHQCGLWAELGQR